MVKKVKKSVLKVKGQAVRTGVKATMKEKASKLSNIQNTFKKFLALQKDLEDTKLILEDKKNSVISKIVESQIQSRKIRNDKANATEESDSLNTKQSESIKEQINKTQLPQKLDNNKIDSLKSVPQQNSQTQPQPQPVPAVMDKPQNIAEGIAVSQQSVEHAAKDGHQLPRAKSPHDTPDLDSAFLIAHQEQLNALITKESFGDAQEELNESVARLTRKFPDLKLIDLVKRESGNECNFTSKNDNTAIINLKNLDGNQLSFTFLDENFTGVIKVQRKDKSGLKPEADVLRVYKGEIVDIVFVCPYPTRENCRIFDIAKSMSECFTAQSFEGKDKLGIYKRKESDIFQESKFWQNKVKNDKESGVAKPTTIPNQDSVVKQRRNSQIIARQGG